MLTILIESVSVEALNNFTCLPNLKNNCLYYRVYWVLCNLTYKSKVIYASEKSMNLHDFFPLVIASFHNSSVGFTHKWEAWPLQQRNKNFFSSYEIKLALWNKSLDKKGTIWCYQPIRFWLFQPQCIRKASMYELLVMSFKNKEKVLNRVE